MSLTPTTEWSETSPAGTDNIALGDNRIREMKTQIREVIDVDHDFPSSGSAADVGQHKKVTLQEQADLGTGAVGATILGSQTISGKGELVYTDEDDNDIQITSLGNILSSSLSDLANNTYRKAVDNAGTGTVNLIKANASDQAEIGVAALLDGGAILPEIAAPTTAANQGALYTKNDGTQTELYFREESDGDEVQITKGGLLNKNLGSAASKSLATNYEAETDGFVSVYVAVNSGSNGSATLFVDGTTTPSTTVAVSGGGDQAGNAAYSHILYPVKKGNYYKVTSTASSATVTWIPLS